MTGGYKTDWNDDDDGRGVGQMSPLLIVQDCLRRRCGTRANYQLPGASFAERRARYVNHADRLQSFEWAIRPPAGVMTEGQLFWRLLGRNGLYKPRQVLEEVAREIAYFAAAAEPVPPTGSI